MTSQPILIPVKGKESGDRWFLTGYWLADKESAIAAERAKL